MYNNNDDFNDVHDFDDDIQLRKELIEEAKSIEVSSDWNAINRDIMSLKRRWKQIPYWESAFEDGLMDEFDQYIDALYGERKKGYLGNEEMKKDIIARAKTASTSTDFRKGTEEMKQLMQEWKDCGSAGKDMDDALWELFNAERQVFFDRKRDHWEQRQKQMQHAYEVKKDVIAQAAGLIDSQEWKKTSEKFHELMEQWKAVGSAGKEHEESLWNTFNTHRQTFYDRRSVYYDELHEEHEKKYEEKRVLVRQAATIATSKEYTKEHTEEMKQLNAAWKAIGSCGKEKEDVIWEEFRSVMDNYFSGLKEWSDERHAQWRQRMQDVRNRKLDLILKQKHGIKRMQDDMVGLLGQRAIDDMEERIQDAKEFIAELEEEVLELDKTLAK